LNFSTFSHVLMAFGVILGLQQGSGRETLWSH
jgi:hypothetical protein